MWLKQPALYVVLGPNTKMVYHLDIIIGGGIVLVLFVILLPSEDREISNLIH